MLNAPYPNPFNPIVNFDIVLSNAQNININIYDVRGEKIDNIFSGLLNQGTHAFNWKAINQSTGVYIIKCETTNLSSTKKVFLIK